MILLFLACQGEPPVAEETAIAPSIPLSAPRLLRRVRLDLNGVLPPVEALDSVEADPSRWTSWRDAWLEDTRFEDRLVSLLSERWHTRVDDFEVDHGDYGFPSEEEYAYERSVGEEPLRLMAHVAAEDAPWTEILTADYTLANERLSGIWPLECPEGDGWKVCRYTDGRPAAGVLSTNGLWWRYPSSPSNLNRGRVAAMARLLVCEDILARPVSFADVPPLVDADATALAIQGEATCLACHSFIEPVAASLLGFYWASQYSQVEQGVYHPEREGLYESLLNVSPAWSGTPLSGLVDLGATLSADPRFESCAVESAAELYWRRVPSLLDRDRLEALRLGWDGRYKSLIRALLDTPEYQAGDDEDPDSEQLAVRLLSPEQLSDTIEDLTGFRWSHDGFDQMDNDTQGYRVLSGGVDGETVTRPQAEPGLTWAVTVKRLSEAAAYSVVKVDLESGAGRLLDGVTLETVPEDAAFSAQIQALGWRLYAERLGEEEVVAWGQLWQQMEDVSDPESAWRGLLSAMFRDARMVTY